jgi:hypothetical protein
METPFIFTTGFAVLMGIVSLAMIICFFFLVKMVDDIHAELATKKPLPLLHKKYHKAMALYGKEAAAEVLKEMLYTEWLGTKGHVVSSSELEETKEESAKAEENFIISFNESLRKKYEFFLDETGVFPPSFTKICRY